MSQLTIIAAMDVLNGIGMSNILPWDLPEDLAHFKRVTTGHPIIMGRKTFDSIGRPLPNRRNIVVTGNAGWQRDGVETVGSVEAAIALLDGVKGFVIGGAQIYRQALPFADELIFTEITACFDCDTFFPDIDRNVWRETARSNHYSNSAELAYSFVTLRRTAQA
jgi:dihydrofolate reductase